MKRFLLLLIPLFILTSCNSPLLTGKSTYNFSNKSSYDVQIKIADDIYTINKDKTLSIDLIAGCNFNIEKNKRVNLKNTSSRQYDIVNNTVTTVKVYNSSSYDILLSEKNNCIGTIAEYQQAIEAKQSVSILIPAGETKTIELYNNNPEYYATFKHNNMPANIALLSFI